MVGLVGKTAGVGKPFSSYFIHAEWCETSSRPIFIQRMVSLLDPS